VPRLKIPRFCDTWQATSTTQHCCDVGYKNISTKLATLQNPLMQRIKNMWTYPCGSVSQEWGAVAWPKLPGNVIRVDCILPLPVIWLSCAPCSRSPFCSASDLSLSQSSVVAYLWASAPFTYTKLSVLSLDLNPDLCTCNRWRPMCNMLSLRDTACFFFLKFILKFLWNYSYSS